jgi:Protein of unknown function (DUF3891)
VILRPSSIPQHASSRICSVWEAISRTQAVPPRSCGLVTQPDHAHVAGEIAAAIRTERLPRLITHVIRAISLHDEGWSGGDAEMLDGRREPGSFVHADVAEFISAWRASIHAAAMDSAVGGIIVSRHFCRLVQPRASAPHESNQDRQQIKDFLVDEREHQARLARQQEHSEAELERFTDVLQFCDALSLYLCCGAAEQVELPQDFGAGATRGIPNADHIRVEPSPFGSQVELAVPLVTPQRQRELVHYLVS